MSSAAAIPEEIIVKTFGPFVTGIMLQMLLMGVVVVQVYDYYRVFYKDAVFNKVLVGVLFAVSVLQATMDYKTLYRAAVEFYGNFDKFDDTDWTLWWEIGVTALIGSIAQTFFLYRCWAATKSWIVLGLGTAGILCSLASGIASSIMFENIGRLSRVPEIPAPILTWLISTAIVDLAIAAVLIFHITRVKSRFRKTETIITKIVRITFQTSALTATIAVINVILYMALPGEAFHLLPQLVMGKIYVISTMVTLSSRTELRNVYDATHGSSYQETRIQGGATAAGGKITKGASESVLQIQSTPNIQGKGGIQVSTTTFIRDDNDQIINDVKSDIELRNVQNGGGKGNIPIQYLGSGKQDEESDSEIEYKAPNVA